MKQVIIALVSDQRIQNLIPLFQHGRPYTHLVLVLSKERTTGVPAKKYLDAASRIKAIAEQQDVQVRQSDTPVDPFKIEDAEQLVTKYIEAFGQDSGVDINFTGGTKPMAIGALRAAQKCSKPALYVNTEDNELLWIQPDNTLRSEPIRVHGLGLDQYIAAYGEAILRKVSASEIDSVEIEWARLIATQHAVIYPIVNRVTRQVKQAWKEKTDYPVGVTLHPTRKQQALIKRLETVGLWSWDKDTSTLSIPDLSRASFLNGRWVEVFTATNLEEDGSFDEIAMNITLEGIEGEIDVAAIANGRLALFECKSNVKSSQQLAKLDSFRKNLGGPYALAFYVRASLAYEQQVRSQAGKWRVNRTFMGAEIVGLAKTVVQLMGVGLRSSSPSPPSPPTR